MALSCKCILDYPWRLYSCFISQLIRDNMGALPFIFYEHSSVMAEISVWGKMNSRRGYECLSWLHSIITGYLRLGKRNKNHYSLYFSLTLRLSQAFLSCFISCWLMSWTCIFSAFLTFFIIVCWSFISNLSCFLSPSQSIPPLVLKFYPFFIIKPIHVSALSWSLSL